MSLAAEPSLGVGGNVEKAMHLLENLRGDATDPEVSLVRFVRGMVAMGYTSTDAIGVLDTLIDSDLVHLTPRYNLAVVS